MDDAWWHQLSRWLVINNVLQHLLTTNSQEVLMILIRTACFSFKKYYRVSQVSDLRIVNAIYMCCAAMCFKCHYSYSSKHGLRAWRWPVTKASAASDENLLKVTTFPFQLSSCQHRLWHWSIPATPHVTGHTNILKLNKYIYFIYTYKMLICTAYPSECKGGHQESFNFCHGTSSRLYISIMEIRNSITEVHNSVTEIHNEFNYGYP